MRDEIDCVMAYLTDAPEFPDHRFSHFTRQSDYIELDGSRFVTRLFPLERIHQMIEEFEQRMGIALISDFHANKSVEFKNPTLAAPVIAAKDALKKILPPRAIHRLRQIALAALTTKGADAIERQVYDSKEIAGFIETHYADDFRLYQASTQRVVGVEAD